MKELHVVHALKTKNGPLHSFKWVEGQQTWEWKDGFCVVTTAEGVYRVPAAGVKFEFAPAKKSKG